MQGLEAINPVEMGSMVTLAYNGSQEIIQVVAQEESDPLNGKISFSSPLGGKLRHRRVGDKAVISTPDGQITYKVVKIE